MVIIPPAPRCPTCNSALPVEPARCSFCKAPWVSHNICMESGVFWNACGRKECQEQINEIVKKNQETYRAQQAQNKDKK